MSTYDIAHIREQGVDLIIIPLQSTFGCKNTREQSQVCSSLQAAARSAGLAGTVVPVWDAGGGRMKSLAPRSMHPFFASIDLAFVAQNINRRLMVY